MNTRIALISAAAAVVALPTAFAAERFEAEFTYSPVEVSTPEGAAETYADLEAMIENYCEPESSQNRIRERTATENCVKVALDDAVRKMDKPEITRIHEASQG
ncbi:MAG: UrcA family protein [Pseudomonadota bacterium]